jgi:hypothetical protein
LFRLFLRGSLQDVLIKDFGLDLTDWQLQQARGISDDGLNIVGLGINPDGKMEAWIANLQTFPQKSVPEKFSIVPILVLGTLGLGSALKRKLKQISLDKRNQ